MCVGVACTGGDGSVVRSGEVNFALVLLLIGSSQLSKPGTTPETYSDLWCFMSLACSRSSSALRFVQIGGDSFPSRTIHWLSSLSSISSSPEPRFSGTADPVSGGKGIGVCDGGREKLDKGCMFWNEGGWVGKLTSDPMEGISDMGRRDNWEDSSGLLESWSPSTIASSALLRFLRVRLGFSSGCLTYPICPCSPWVMRLSATICPIFSSNLWECFLYLSRQDCHVCLVTHSYSGSVWGGCYQCSDEWTINFEAYLFTQLLVKSVTRSSTYLLIWDFLRNPLAHIILVFCRKLPSPVRCHQERDLKKREKDWLVSGSPSPWIFVNDRRVCKRPVLYTFLDP